jgi:hypothetical protein
MGTNTIGSASSGSKFYVVQHIGVYEDCDTPLMDPPFVVDAEPTFSGSVSTTTLVNTAVWPQGEYKFCHRLQLWKWNDDRMDSYVWQEMDTSFTVEVTHTSGAVQLKAPIQLVPIVKASLPSSEAYPYGASIPIDLIFSQDLDYKFDVNIESILLINENDEILEDAAGDIVVEEARFEWTQPSKAGVLTVRLPMAVYEMGLTTVRVLVPLTYEGRNRHRGLRGLSAGVWDEIIEIMLSYVESSEDYGHAEVPLYSYGDIDAIPYSEKSSAITSRFSFSGLVLIVCSTVAAILAP